MPRSVPFDNREVGQQCLDLGALQRNRAQPFRTVPSQKQRQKPVTKSAVRVVDNGPSENTFVRPRVPLTGHQETEIRTTRVARAKYRSWPLGQGSQRNQTRSPIASVRYPTASTCEKYASSHAPPIGIVPTLDDTVDHNIDPTQKMPKRPVTDQTTCLSDRHGLSFHGVERAS
jgi:hypothetical protein